MKPRIFYDGGCGLCQKEIYHYQSLDKDGAIEWVDIFKNPQTLHVHSIEYMDAMAVLHGINKNGEIIKGVGNFISIWQNIDRYQWLAACILRLRLTGVLQWCYMHFAKWRFKKRMGQACILKSDAEH